VAADDNLNIANLVLWEPVVNGSSYVRQNRQRSQIRAQMTHGADAKTAVATAEGGFDFDGFFINEKLQEEMSQVDLQSAPLPKVKRLLLLQISGSPRLKKPFEDLAARVHQGSIETKIENVAVEAFWSSIGLIDTSAVRDHTLQWLEKTAPMEPFTKREWYVFEPTQESAQRHLLPEQRKSLLYSTTEPTPGVSAAIFGFQSGNEHINGVLYLPSWDHPEYGKKEVERCVLLLHGWSGYRIGPGQLLNETARELAKNGFAAYSFDFRGRGESELEVNQASLNSMIRDATRAVSILHERHSWDESVWSKFTLLGLCSGGEVAIGASLSDSRIDSLALWSAPVFSGAFDLARQARRSRSAIQKYARKFFMPETWTKLFSGSVNWKMVRRAVSGGRSNEDAGVEDKAPDTQSQMNEFEAFTGKLLFIYGGNDPETPPSRDFYREFVERTKMPHEFQEIEGANHNYYSVEWKREVINLTVDWLKKLDSN
jgi:alpha-beta hydrolase superfamily lysophospholipase